MQQRAVIVTSKVLVVIAGKGITLVISNENMADFVRMIKSLENSGILIYWVSKIVELKIKIQEVRFLGILLGAEL